MPETPPSLLDRLREQSGDADAWRRFDDLYRPLLLSWLHRYGLQDNDAHDVVQEIMATIVGEMPRFHYDPARGSFRSWLQAILVNKLRLFWRSAKAQPLSGGHDFLDNLLHQLEDPASNLARLWEQEHDRHLAQKLLTQIEHDFTPTTWQAFQRLFAGEAAETIAADLNLSINAVFLAQSRVLRRLRQEKSLPERVDFRAARWGR